MFQRRPAGRDRRKSHANRPDGSCANITCCSHVEWPTERHTRCMFEVKRAWVWACFASMQGSGNLALDHQ